MSELDALDPVPETVTLSTGTVVVLESLRTRQFFKFLRIITRGALPSLQDLSIFKMDGDSDPREFAGRLVSLMLLSVPEAEQEAIDFIQSMCKPVGLVDRRSGRLNKQDLERNTELWANVLTDLDNPELDDLVSIVEAIVKREAGDIQALGKRLGAMFALAEKTGQLPNRNPTSPGPNSSADSPEPTTFSATSTDGTTSASTTFHFGGSGNASQLYTSGATTPNVSASSG
jgi:hypothetical protein